MSKLDRLAWADGVAVRAFGLRIGLRVSDSQWMPRVIERLPAGYRVSRSAVVDTLFSFRHGGRVPGTNVRRFHMLFTNYNVEARTHDRDDLLDAFESALHARLVRQARGYHFVHAGCVGWRGRAIVVPGHSRAGKSTLVQALVAEGATYYSDEYAVFDRRGRVHAFPSPLRLRRDDGGVDRVVHDNAATASRAPLPLGLVVQTRFTPDGVWNPRPLAPGERVLALLPHAARTNLAPASVMAVFARSTAGAAGIETPRAHAADVAPRILHQLSDETHGAAKAAEDGR